MLQRGWATRAELDGLQRAATALVAQYRELNAREEREAVDGPFSEESLGSSDESDEPEEAHDAPKKRERDDEEPDAGTVEQQRPKLIIRLPAALFRQTSSAPGNSNL